MSDDGTKHDKNSGHGYDGMTDAILLEKVKKGWNHRETPCGFGSLKVNTVLVRENLLKIADKYEIKSVSDIGAGDLNWILLTEWNINYKGYDLYPRHKDVIQFDATKEVLAKTDMILCRHVLNHLSIQFSERCLSNFKKSGSKYLCITNFDRQQDYWNQYGLKMKDYGYTLIDTYQEVGKWRNELYILNDQS